MHCTMYVSSNLNMEHPERCRVQLGALRHCRVEFRYTEFAFGMATVQFSGPPQQHSVALIAEKMQLAQSWHKQQMVSGKVANRLV